MPFGFKNQIILSSINFTQSHMQKAISILCESKFDRLVELINAIPGLSCRKPHGAFYVMMNIRGITGKRCHGTELTGSTAIAEALDSFPDDIPDVYREAISIEAEDLRDNVGNRSPRYAFM